MSNKVSSNPIPASEDIAEFCTYIHRNINIGELFFVIGNLKKIEHLYF